MLKDQTQKKTRTLLSPEKLILGMRNSILGMASHNLSNTKTTILGATPGAILGIDGHPYERFSFAPAFSERYFKNQGGHRAPDKCILYMKVLESIRSSLIAIVKQVGSLCLHPYERFSFAPAFSERYFKNCWPGPSAEKNCRGFLLYKIWRILSGIFLEDFSGHFFPQKWGEKIRRQNPRQNPAAQKLLKSARNPFCPKPTLRIGVVLAERTCKICITYSFIVDNPNILGNCSVVCWAGPTGRGLPNIFPYLGVPEYFR